MRKEIADKWVAALQSGEYKQGRMTLSNPYGEFCCLGVLCELAVEEGVIEPSDEVAGVITYDGEYTQFLPEKVKRWAEMKNPSGRFVIYGQIVSLTGYNDKGKSFLEISEIIKENVEMI